LSVVYEAGTKEMDESLRLLGEGAVSLKEMAIPRRLELIYQCIEAVGQVAREWVEAACDAKRIDKNSLARVEEVTAGPLATIRFLQLFGQTLKDVQSNGSPRIPGVVVKRHGQCRVPVFPTRQMYDALLFRPMAAETWLDPAVDANAIHRESLARCCGKKSVPEVVVVLGAGNVSSIPATDALSKIFGESCAVALKLNPVNAYLGSFFESAFKPLVDANLFRLSSGGMETGQHLIQHPATNGVHITGSINSHDNIVWGVDSQREQRRQTNQPILQKSITSELGNVSPWAIVPGQYTRAELWAQAQTIASSITNNVSFNCIATKLIVTCRNWPQRQEFLGMIEEIMSGVPRRFAYYPGAAERFERFSDIPATDPERLPWTLLRDIDPVAAPHLLQDESFTCVCAELAIEADSESDFMFKATELMNEQVWGTLAATFTLTSATEKRYAAELDECLRKLRYGTIGINQWPALSFALMSPPWGGHPSSNLQNAQSGIGFVHNTYLLDRPEKTILRAPLKMMPKPIWYTSHRHPEQVAWDMLHMYLRPSPLRLPRLFWSSLTG